MSGDYFTHNDRQPMHSTTLKWTEDGELSPLDMDRVLTLLTDQTQMGQSNPRWKNGSPMQE